MLCKITNPVMQSSEWEQNFVLFKNLKYLGEIFALNSGVYINSVITGLGNISHKGETDLNKCQLCLSWQG